MNEPSPHPDLSVSLLSTGIVEIKVENRYISRPTIGRIIKQTITDLLVGFLFTFSWFKLRNKNSPLYSSLWLCVTLLYIYNQCTQVFHESILVIPRHGIQLETHRGFKFALFPGFPLTTKHRFIPLTSVRDIVINEGLRRWDVAFENLLPRLPILEIVYRHIHKTLLPTPQTNGHLSP